MEEGTTDIPMAHIKKRTEKLGFKPQKELDYNHILPYADQLDEESCRMFNDIKTNFGKAVMLKEMKPGCAMWTSRLMKYIKLYGLKFSKEDHIDLIYLVYELIIIPDLEPTKLHKFATLLILLTKKKHLLSPDDVVLPWRPLYDIGQKIFSKSLSMYHYFSTLESTFDLLIYCVKPYFPLSATREILDEIMPRFSPWNCSTQETLQQLMLYLPCTQQPQHMGQGFQLWLDQLMTIWRVCHNAPPWESDMMILMANTAHNNIGYIDWEPHIPLMFTRFLRSFNLPVFYKQTQTTKQHSIDICGMALWIVSVIGPDSSAQKHLDNFMTTVVTYLHSANTGRWSYRLRELLRKLPYQFVQRVHKERKNYNNWENKIPESHKLREEDITAFVECMLNVALQAMFSRMGANDACIALQHLAVLRPAMVIAPTIERMWSSLDSLTEPHKLTCAMQCVVAVAKPLASGFSNGYAEGPTHIIPLLLSSLPGLDPNDFKKTLVTLHFISVFCTFVPLVNCSGASEYWPDLTEEEHTVCEATAQIEDFVLQFFDRVFTLVESSIMEHTRMEQKDSEIRNKLESASEGALASAAIGVLMQTSTEIFKMALKKFFNFVTQRILEINVAGLTAASLCRAFARVNAHETFKLFIPHLCDSIMELLGEGDELYKEETLDNELLFNMLILSHIVEREGCELLPYVPRILTVLDRTLNLICKEGYFIASSTLQNIISSLCSVYHKEFRSSTKDYDADVKDILAIREWGKPGNLWNCNLHWHVPTEKEIECIQTILNRYLPGELDKLKKHISGEKSLSREELNRCLNILRSLLAANPVLPAWEDEPLVLIESQLPDVPFTVITGITGSVSMPDGSNIRKTVSDVMHALQEQLLNAAEDDTKNLGSVISIWDILVVYSNISSTHFETHLKAFSVVKRTLEDRLAGRSGHPRALLADRTLLQQEFRAQSSVGPLTRTHARIMQDLVTLATSRYSGIRMRAQSRLNWMLTHYAYAFYAILPQLTECLSADPVEDHEKLKGALYCLLGPKQTPLVTKHDWKVVDKLWPAVVYSKPSEKTSIIRLLDCILNSIHLHFPTITIIPKWSDACMDKAKVLLSESVLNDPSFLALMEKGDENLKKCGDENMKAYHHLLNTLMEGADSKKLHWRHATMCVSLIPSLIHADVMFPPQTVRLLVNSLINDYIHVRKIATRLMLLVLKQRKKKHKKIEVDPFKMANVPKPESDSQQLSPGFRPDNNWLQFESDKDFTKEEWSKSPYIHKDCYGFYYWPKPFEMYAPPDEQPPFEPPEEMEEGNRAIYDFFANKDNVDKLMGFLCMEEKKGKDKFSGVRFSFFKRLFANFGDAFLDNFADHLTRLVADKQESLQRCGAEIVAGLIKATKHWPFDKVDRLRTLLTPIIKNALENMTTETVGDWGTCFATASERMDLTRIAWVVRELEGGGQGVGAGAGGSAAECGRLYALQAAVAQHPWRGAGHAQVLLNHLREHKMISHPYQIVRDRVAGLMTNLFETDITFPDSGPQNVGPKIKEMMDEIAPKLEILLKEGLKGVSSGNDLSAMPSSMVNLIPNQSTNCASGSGMRVEGHTNRKPHPSSNDVASERIRSMIQDSIQRVGVEKGAVNKEAISKIMQDMKSNVNLRELKNEFENGRTSPLDTFILRGFVEPKLQNNEDFTIANILENENLLKNLKLADDMETVEEVEPIKVQAEETEYDVNLRLFKTALKWVTNAVSRSPFGARSDYYVLVPVACALGAREGDEELCRLCGAFLAALAQGLHDPASLTVALSTVNQVCSSPSWCARSSCLGFLQSLVFHNMALVVGGPSVDEVRQLVLRLMADARPEVRETAAQMMAGLLHCGAIQDQTQLLDHFKGLCRGGKMKKGPGATEALAKRHCGVLGLCSFVAAHPYTVPAYLPEVFQLLSRHLNDPMPIPSTIRKTLGDFKRTHHDDWQNQQLKFTEDELSVLSDLSAPPSYYA